MCHDNIWPYGWLAKKILGKEFNLQVMNSRAGFYIGTQLPDGLPASRESVEYWDHQDEAARALDVGTWTQRREP